MSLRRDALQRITTGCGVSMIVKPRQLGRPGPTGGMSSHGSEDYLFLALYMQIGCVNFVLLCIVVTLRMRICRRNMYKSSCFWMIFLNFICSVCFCFNNVVFQRDNLRINCSILSITVSYHVSNFMRV